MRQSTTLKWVAVSSLIWTACSASQPPVSSTPPTTTAATITATAAPVILPSADVRPNSKGQKVPLQTGTLEGELAVPLEVDSQLVAQLQGLSPSEWLWGAPAWAEEATLTEAQIRQFKVQVDEEDVAMEIISIKRGAEEYQVEYRLPEVKTTTNAVVEFVSPSGTVRLSGIIPEIKVGVKVRTTEKIDLHSTALAFALRSAAAEQGGKPIKELNFQQDIKTFAGKAEVLQLKESLRSFFKDKNNRGQDFRKKPELLAPARQVAKQFINRLPRPVGPLLPTPKIMSVRR